MKFELNNLEKNLLKTLCTGIEEISIYSYAIYPDVVSFSLLDKSIVTIKARDEYIAPKFEVFPICVTSDAINFKPKKTMVIDNRVNYSTVSLLQTSEWEIPSNSTNIFEGFEGKEKEIPRDAIHATTLDAGIELLDDLGRKFQVASSAFPLSLYVSNCEFSEKIDERIYDRIALV